MNVKEGVRRIGLLTWAIWAVVATYLALMAPGRAGLEARLWLAGIAMMGGAIIIVLLGVALIWIVNGFRK